MSDKKDDQILDEYLKGNSDLSRRYRAESVIEPPAYLNEKIITAAKKAAEDKKPVPGSRWYVPLSLAAVIVISFSVAFKIYDEESMPGSKQDIKKPAIMHDGRTDSLSDVPVGTMRDEIRSSSEEIVIEEDRDIKMRSLSREAAPSSVPEVKEEMSQRKHSEDTYVEDETPAQSSMEVPAVTPAPAESGRELEKRKAGAIATSELANGLSPQQWFELINQLWFEGDEAGAYDGLRKFVVTYPDYPEDQLEKNIPRGMDVSRINR